MPCLSREIALVRRPPVRQRAVTFAFHQKRKRFVDLAQPPLDQLHCFKERPGDARSVTMRFPTFVMGPSLTAQHVARFRPAKTNSAISSPSVGLSPNESPGRVARDL